MTLYETIFTRRQVRNYLNSPVPKDHLDHILACATRHAALALENEGNKVLSVTPVTDGKEFSIEISYS